MFFIVSKVFWFVAAPSNLLMLGALIGCAIVARRALMACAVLVALIYSPLAALPLQMVETRFPTPAGLPEAPTGIIVLGGAARHLEGWPRPRLNDAGDRLLAMAQLAAAYPEAPLVFTGGEGSLRDVGRAEADIVRNLAASLDLDTGRVLFEARSRNTAENARFTKALLQEAGLPLDGWLLVTSAFHMPRAVGAFRAQEVGVLPYPVDHRGRGALTLAARLTALDLGAREWLGLVAYRITGRTRAIWPAP